MTPDKDYQDETLPEDIETEFDMKLGFVLKSGVNKKHPAMTMIVWGDESQYLADLTHRKLWEKLVQTYSFLMGSFNFSDPEVGGRWAQVKDYVLNGGDIDATLLDSQEKGV